MAHEQRHEFYKYLKCLLYSSLSSRKNHRKKLHYSFITVLHFFFYTYMFVCLSHHKWLGCSCTRLSLNFLLQINPRYRMKMLKWISFFVQMWNSLPAILLTEISIVGVNIKRWFLSAVIIMEINYCVCGEQANANNI